MSLDGLSLSLLVAELNGQLCGGRIEKIFQPDTYTILLWVRIPGKTVRLVLSADPRQPRLHITTNSFENPDTPPAFCMLLRKHLNDGRIQSIEQHELDRTVMINFDVREERGVIATKTLVGELMGKHSNIILIHEHVIIDAVRRVGVSMSRYRQVLPGRHYLLPPGQEQFNMLKITSEELFQRLRQQTGQLYKGIMNLTMGFGPVTIKEVLWRSGIIYDARIEDIEESGWQSLKLALNSIIQPVSKRIATPHIRVNQLNKVTGFAGFKLTHLVDKFYEFASMNEAVEFVSRLVPVAIPDKERLQKFVSAELTRLQRKKDILVEELEQAMAADKLKKCGDTIMTYLWQLQQGQTMVELPDIYSEQSDKKLLIELDPRYTPQQNAQVYYNRYNKQKRAQLSLKDQIVQAGREFEYLDSILVTLDHAQTSQEIREIEQELISGGYLTKTSKKKPEPVSAPLTVSLGDGDLIIVGKNNRQNDIVTFKIGRPTDLWFHTKDIPGSHVILRTQNAADMNAIRTAAMLAVYFSKARQSSNVPVDYTFRRSVRKPNGSKPGFVTYEKQTTIYITPDDDTIAELLKNKKS